MKIIDPISMFGIDSGMRSLVVSPAERTALLRAVAILERAHGIVDGLNPDHQGNDEDIGDALCLAPSAIRTLATEGLDVSFECSIAREAAR